MSGDHVLMPSPVMEVISVPNVATAATPHATVLETKSKYILYKIVTPYYVMAWHLALQHADLLHLFPNLVHDLTYGSPIGNLPPLSHTFIPNNLGSANIDPAYMDSFLEEEVTSGHMDGLFTVDYAHQIFNGHLWTVPLGFVENPGSTALRLICHHSKEDHFSMSTNGWINMTFSTAKFYSVAHATAFMNIYSNI